MFEFSNQLKMIFAGKGIPIIRIDSYFQYLNYTLDIVQFCRTISLQRATDTVQEAYDEI